MSTDILLTVSATARLAECSENYVRRAANRGLVTASRDSSGRRLFTAEDAEAIRLHRLQKQANPDAPA
jgi:DNA-binding transcriptional MerR regulator